jgi:uncharacterized protein (TIGR02145 family)
MGNNKLILMFTVMFIMVVSSCKKEETLSGCGDVSSFNYGGITYHTVTIGTQCWMKENLNVGTMISGSTVQTNNAGIEKYCYDNSDVNCSTYGGLYQWDEAMQYSQTDGSKGICADGWHIPTDAEWTAMVTALGTNPGTKLKHNGSTGFEGLLAGFRTSTSTFSNSTQYGYFWTSTKSDASQAWFRQLTTFDALATRNYNYKVLGFSVRCIKN